MINKKQNGFTLIELVVAMGVFLSLFLIVIVNFRSGESINELNLETQKIASDIRKVQTLALTGSSYNSQSIGAGGYGIKFLENNNNYIIFNDVNADGIYTVDVDSLLETKSLVSNINSLVFKPTRTNVYIVFKPYSSEVGIITSEGAWNEELEIRITHTRATSKTGIISITPVSGKIDFELTESE